MSKRKTSSRYRLYYIPDVNENYYGTGFASTYVLYDFVANKIKSENGRFFHPSLIFNSILLHTFDQHPGSFADIRQSYPELFI